MEERTEAVADYSATQPVLSQFTMPIWVATILSVTDVADQSARSPVLSVPLLSPTQDDGCEMWCTIPYSLSFAVHADFLLLGSSSFLGFHLVMRTTGLELTFLSHGYSIFHLTHLLAPNPVLHPACCRMESLHLCVWILFPFP